MPLTKESLKIFFSTLSHSPNPQKPLDTPNSTSERNRASSSTQDEPFPDYDLSVLTNLLRASLVASVNVVKEKAPDFLNKFFIESSLDAQMQHLTEQVLDRNTPVWPSLITMMEEEANNTKNTELTYAYKELTLLTKLYLDNKQNTADVKKNIQIKIQEFEAKLIVAKSFLLPENSLDNQLHKLHVMVNNFDLTEQELQSTEDTIALLHETIKAVESDSSSSSTTNPENSALTQLREQLKQKNTEKEIFEKQVREDQLNKIAHQNAIKKLMEYKRKEAEVRASINRHGLNTDKYITAVQSTLTKLKELINNTKEIGHRTDKDAQKKSMADHINEMLKSLNTAIETLPKITPQNLGKKQEARNILVQFLRTINSTAFPLTTDPTIDKHIRDILNKLSNPSSITDDELIMAALYCPLLKVEAPASMNSSSANPADLFSIARYQLRDIWMKSYEAVNHELPGMICMQDLLQLNTWRERAMGHDAIPRACSLVEFHFRMSQGISNSRAILTHLSDYLANNSTDLLDNNTKKRLEARMDLRKTYESQSKLEEELRQLKDKASALQIKIEQILVF